MNAHKEWLDWLKKQPDGSDPGTANAAVPGREGAFKAGLNRGWSIAEESYNRQRERLAYRESRLQELVREMTEFFS